MYNILIIRRWVKTFIDFKKYNINRASLMDVLFMNNKWEILSIIIYR